MRACTAQRKEHRGLVSSINLAHAPMRAYASTCAYASVAPTSMLCLLKSTRVAYVLQYACLSEGMRRVCSSIRMPR